VRASLSLPVSFPDEFPKLSPPRLALSTLEGLDGVASGTITLTGSAKGATRACLGPLEWAEPNTATRYSSSASDQSCFDLEPNQVRPFEVQVTTNKAADETVTANLPVLLTGVSSDGRAAEIAVDVPVGFSAIRPTNQAVKWWTVAALMLLILALQLLALWIVGRILAQFRPPDGPMTRGTMPVSIRVTGQTATVALPDGQPTKNAAALERTREFQGPDGSQFSAEAPPLFNLFKSPQGVIHPPAGTRVFSNYRESTLDSGAAAPVGLSLGSTV
jgi:hypothetical protein